MSFFNIVTALPWINVCFCLITTFIRGKKKKKKKIRLMNNLLMDWVDPLIFFMPKLIFILLTDRTAEWSCPVCAHLTHFPFGVLKSEWVSLYLSCDWMTEWVWVNAGITPCGRPACMCGQPTSEYHYISKAISTFSCLLCPSVSDTFGPPLHLGYEFDRQDWPARWQ